MREKSLVLSLLMLVVVSCQTPQDYFQRPDVSPTINNTGTGFRNGVEVDTTNFICVDSDEYNSLQDYYSDKEYRLYRCLKFNRCK